jgi:hypothetical protein
MKEKTLLVLRTSPPRTTAKHSYLKLGLAQDGPLIKQPGSQNLLKCVSPSNILHFEWQAKRRCTCFAIGVLLGRSSSKEFSGLISFSHRKSRVSLSNVGNHVGKEANEHTWLYSGVFL